MLSAFLSFVPFVLEVAAEIGSKTTVEGFWIAGLLSGGETVFSGFFDAWPYWAFPRLSFANEWLMSWGSEGGAGGAYGFVAAPLFEAEFLDSPCLEDCFSGPPCEAGSLGPSVDSALSCGFFAWSFDYSDYFGSEFFAVWSCFCSGFCAGLFYSGLLACLTSSFCFLPSFS